MRPSMNKLLLVIIILVLVITPILNSGCLKDDSEEVDWGLFMAFVIALYYEFGINPDTLKNKHEAPTKPPALKAPTGAIRVNTTDQNAAGAVTGGGGGHTH